MTPFQRFLLDRETTLRCSRPETWTVETENGRALLEVSEQHLVYLEGLLGREGFKSTQAILAKYLENCV